MQNNTQGVTLDKLAELLKDHWIGDIDKEVLEKFINTRNEEVKYILAVGRKKAYAYVDDLNDSEDIELLEIIASNTAEQLLNT